MRRRSFATVLVGPSALLREGLTRILSAADFRIVASASCIDDLVLTASPKNRPILLVIDAGDDLRAAVGQVEIFKQRHPAGRIAVLADNDQPSDIVSAFRAGANAYFIKVAPCDTFIKALELVMLGETILPAAVLSALSDRTDDDEDDHEIAARDNGVPAGKLLEAESDNTPHLSARELCILHCLIEGDSNKVIARKINIAEATVKVHVKAILRKIRVHNRTQAAIWAMNNDLSIGAIGNGSSARVKTAGPVSLGPGLIPALPATEGNGSALLPAITQSVEGAPHRTPNGGPVARLGINRRSC
jgi:two-component system, NarL family, nitrate/nitrite response regulator NarL